MTKKIDYSLPIAQRIQKEWNVKIETSKIHPNSWNSNVLQPHHQKALGESLKMFTQIEPLVVRPHPHIEGEYEIVNGEHRYLEGLEYYYCNVITGLQDEEYELYTSASKAHGEEDPVKLNVSLKRVEKKLGDRAYLPVPHTKETLAKMLEAAKEKLPPEASDEFTRMVFSVPTDAVEIVREVLERYMRAGNIQGKSESINLGRALEYMCAEQYGG